MRQCKEGHPAQVCRDQACRHPRLVQAKVIIGCQMQYKHYCLTKCTGGVAVIEMGNAEDGGFHKYFHNKTLIINREKMVVDFI